MIYKLEFLSQALKEWKSLDRDIQTQFKKKLKERLENPHIESSKLSGSNNKSRYKIKLRSLGYRLVYEVIDNELVVIVIAVGKREKNRVYRAADDREINQ